MIHASANWKQQFQFEGKGNGAIPVAMDGDGKTGNSPSELVLIALCGCTAYDVVSILQKKREPLTGLEVSAEAEKAASPSSVSQAGPEQTSSAAPIDLSEPQAAEASEAPTPTSSY